MLFEAYQSASAGLLRNAHSRLVEQEKLNATLRVDKGQAHQVGKPRT